MRLVIAFLCLCAAQPVFAATPCAADFETFAKGLKERFGEVPQVAGVMPPGLPLVFFANPATGTWTIVFQAADGTFCSPASGAQFKTIPPGQPI